MWGLFILSNNIDIKLVPVETYWKNSSAEETTVCVPFSVLFSWNKTNISVIAVQLPAPVCTRVLLFIYEYNIYIHLYTSFLSISCVWFSFHWKELRICKGDKYLSVWNSCSNKMQKKQRMEEQKKTRAYSCIFLFFLSCFFCSLTL